MGRNILLGFAGPGKVTHNTVKDLLKDYLSLGAEDTDGVPAYPEDVDEIRVVIPAGDKYLTPSVLLLLEWAADYAKLPYEAVWDFETDLNQEILDESDKEIEATNVSMALVDRLVEGVKNGVEVTLVVAWGDPQAASDETTELLVDLASAKGLAVKGIDQGMDDLHFGVDPEPEPEEKPTRRGRRTAPQPDAGEEKPRARRGKPRESAEKPSEPAEAVQEESVEAESSHARQKAQKAAEVTPRPEGDVIMRALQDARWMVRSLDNTHAAMSGREEAVPCELHRKLEEAIEKYDVLRRTTAPAPEPEEPAPSRGGRPRSDGSPAQPRTARQQGKKEWQDEEGTWHRQGRGRIPKGVPTRTVDPKTEEVISEP
jgi:hypothetical protein